MDHASDSSELKSKIFPVHRSSLTKQNWDQSMKMEPQTNFTSVAMDLAGGAPMLIAVVSLSATEIDNTSQPSCIPEIAGVGATAAIRSVSSAVYTRTVFLQLCLVVGLIGLIANGAVLFVMFYYRRLVRKNATNKFICNQAVLDAIACSALAVYVFVESYAKGPYGLREGSSGWIRCLILDNLSWMVSSVYGSQFNLTVIAVERFAMIVHPIGHRKHFRPWMVLMGLVLPWLNGVLTYLIPSWSTTRVAHGRCLSFSFWPVSGMAKAYIAAMTVWQTLFHVVVLVYCYTKIVAVVRRQTMAIGHASVATTANVNDQPSLAPPDGTASGPPRVGLGSQAVTKATAGMTTMSKSERKVIRTMIIIVIFFVICWFPVSLCTLINSFQPLQAIMQVNLFLTMIAYVNPAVNPIIYGAHFNVIHRVWQAIRQLTARLRHGVIHDMTTMSVSGNSHHDCGAAAGHHGAHRTVAASML